MKLFNFKSIILFLILIFCVSSSVLAFTEEEQTEINRLVSTLVANSKNQSTTWQIGLGGSGSGTKVAFFETDFIYNDKECKYLGVMYWNNQCSVTLTDGVLVGKNIDYSKHDLNVYYFDEDLNCLGAKANNLNSGSSITISGVKSYFFSEFTIKNNLGEVIQPFFQLAPQKITEILVEQTEKAQIMEQMKMMMVGFLKYLAVLVISLLAFWKGWQFLSMQLRKA